VTPKEYIHIIGKARSGWIGDQVVLTVGHSMSRWFVAVIVWLFACTAGFGQAPALGGKLARETSHPCCRVRC
jgi:hypothetical protein